MAKLKELIIDVEREIEYDVREIKDCDQRILRLESDNASAKQRIKENRELLDQLKSLLNVEEKKDDLHKENNKM